MAENSCAVGKPVLSAPITALLFINDEFLLSGEGSFLKVYSTISNSHVFCKKIFQKGKRIHKFKVISRNEKGKFCLLVALSGRSLRCFSICSKETDISFALTSEEREFNSWIWDVSKIVWNTNGNVNTCTTLALITSQNKALVWDYDKNKVLSVSNCKEQCILYSACYWGLNYNELVVAVGTVFNEVLIWKPFIKRLVIDQSAEVTEMVKKRLKGHEGVIFSVSFDDSGERLLSVSDDRSIRQWDIENEECLRVLYGHKARVWDAIFMRNYIVSIGEDAFCLVWDSNSTIVRKFKGHKGKNIWSLAVNEDSMTIATGGGDTGIRIWLTEASFSAKVQLNEVNLPNILQTDDFPRNISILSFSELLVVTNTGTLLIYQFKDAELKIILQDEEFSRYSCMAVEKDSRIAALGSLNGKIKVVSIDSEIITEEKGFDGKVFTVFILRRKTDGDLPETYVLASGPNGFIRLWELVASNDIHCKTKFRMTERGWFQQPYCRQRWLAAATLMNQKTSNLGNDVRMNLLVGDRRGSIHVFSVILSNGDNSVALQQPSEPLQTLLSMHGKNGVTSIYYANGWVFSTGRDGFFRKYVINEDGTLNIFEKSKVCKGMDWIEGLLFENDYIYVYGFYMQSNFAVWSTIRNEIILKINCGGGYRSWDLLMPVCEKEQCTFAYLKGPQIMLCEKPPIDNQHILKEALHGRELTCLCTLDHFENNGENADLFATGSEDTLVNLIIYDLTSGTLKVVYRFQGHIGSVKSIASIKEDKCDQKEITNVNEKADREASNIFSSSQSYLLFSCGSRTELKCNRVYYSRNGDVNLVSLAEIGTPMNAAKSSEAYDDVRFLSLAVISLKECSQQPLYCIALACSDGYVRLYGFSTSRNTFILLMASKFHSRCVQVLRHFSTTLESRDHHFILSGATDGRIALWDINTCLGKLISCAKKSESNSCLFQEETANRDSKEERRNYVEFDQKDNTKERFFYGDKVNDSVPLCDCNHEPLHVFDAHQSGIHCIDILSIDAGERVIDPSFVFASGGDDNSIFTSHLKLEKMKNRIICEILWEDKNIFAHQSTITGVQMVGPNQFVSCSIDQRIKVWKTDDSGDSMVVATNSK